MYNIYIYTSIFVTYIQYCNTYYDAMRAFNINSTNINNLSMFSLLLILSELNSETKGSQKDDDNTTSLFILKVILGRINTSKEETITKERLERRDSRDSMTSINDNNTNDNNTDDNNKGTRLVLNTTSSIKTFQLQQQQQRECPAYPRIIKLHQQKIVKRKKTNTKNVMPSLFL